MEKIEYSKVTKNFLNNKNNSMYVILKTKDAEIKEKYYNVNNYNDIKQFF